jgi:hypothetical protein
MANTYTPLASQLLGASTSSVSFTSISQSYTDLVLKISARTDYADVYDGINIRFNSDSSNVYSDTFLQASGATPVSSYDKAVNIGYIRNAANGANATANVFGACEIYISNYTSTSVRPYYAQGVTTTNATNSSFMSLGAYEYQGSSGISTITLTPQIGTNFVSGSRFDLFGVLHN